MNDQARELGETRPLDLCPADLFDAVCRLATQLVARSSATIGLRPDFCRAAGLPTAGARDADGAAGAYVVLADRAAERAVFPPADAEPFVVEVPIALAAGFLRLRMARRPASARDVRAKLESLASIASMHLQTLVEKRQASSEASLHRLLTENSADTLVRGNCDAIRLHVSPAVRRLLGYEPAELVGRRAAEIVHPEDVAVFKAMLEDLREGRIDEGVTEHRQRHRDGHWVWIEALIRPTRDEASGTVDGYVVSARDITKRKSAEARLEHLASHDALTGLANRSLACAILRRTLARDDHLPFAVLYLDLDHFKPINDALGHEAGDTVLQTIAQRFSGALREDDLVSRFGGDEFVVVTGPIARPDAIALALRLMEVAARPIAGDICLGVSVGIAYATDHDIEADALVRIADRALYAAKAAGRSAYHVEDC